MELRTWAQGVEPSTWANVHTIISMGRHVKIAVNNGLELMNNGSNQ